MGRRGLAGNMDFRAVDPGEEFAPGPDLLASVRIIRFRTIQTAGGQDPHHPQ
jgi:hypothetical protein